MFPSTKSCRDSELQSTNDWASDPKNPVNWSLARQWVIILLLWGANTVASICSTAFEPALPYIMNDLGSHTSSLSAFTISIYLVGYCFGPLLVAPVSELYGRLMALYPGFVAYLAALAICGSSNSIAVFIVFRALMGFAGIVFLICGRAIIADIIAPKRRGLAVTLVTSGATFGPTLGPIVGGYIAETIGWRWIFWISIAFLGAFMIGCILILRETYPPILLARHQPESSTRTTEKTASQILLRACTRPLRFIFRSRLILLFTLYTSILNSYLYILLSTLGTTFQTVYGFSAGSSGLAYLGMMTGFVLSQVTLGIFSDLYANRQAQRRGSTDAKIRPEDRLPPLILGAVLLPCALLLYGWTLAKHTAWIAPIIGSGLVALAAMYSYIPVQIYVVDVYPLHTASATGAMSIIRSAISAVVPLGAGPLYARLGYGWGLTLLAGLALPFIVLGAVLVRWGEQIRAKEAVIS
ncbi:putative transporter C1529,01 [Talaromyces islandicus]|uniref:Putative transporter C1529,01 n=1 Tax=Talaromyces islandicus TaxID=28573 RepID=A0A0U1M3T3_TALIS|nr:putative transporter C1529,01 [Talaromyces islandicus]